MSILVFEMAVRLVAAAVEMLDLHKSDVLLGGRDLSGQILRGLLMSLGHP